MSNHSDSFNIIIVDSDGIQHKCREIPTDLGFSKLVDTENQVAILYSSGYGAGWASWNCEHTLQIATDSRIIQYRFFGKNYSKMNFEKFMTQIIGFEIAPYDGGFKSTQVEFIPEGTMFRINEYDGSESIEVFDPNKFMIA
jgi:hypothetical protein